MKLVASMVVRNELSRYLEPVIDSLLTFCDEILVLDDGSDDGTTEWLLLRSWNDPRLRVAREAETTFFEHEGRLRQSATEFALSGRPTHVLAIDADEIVTDGDLVRRLVEDYPRASAFSLCMTEVWRARPEGFDVRCDGRWCPHRAPVLWRVPEGNILAPMIPDRAAAPGRIPTNVIDPSNVVHTDVKILHFGWANESDRPRRHARYADAESFGHDPRHIASILYPDENVATETRPWPKALEPVVAGILAGASAVTA